MHWSAARGLGVTALLHKLVVKVYFRSKKTLAVTICNYQLKTLSFTIPVKLFANM